MPATLTHSPEEPEVERIAPPFWVKRVRIEGYKSLASCDVTLEPFTVLVGRNGAGKSNFLSALALLADVPTADVREVFGSHRSIDEVLCRRTPDNRFSIGVDLDVLDPQGGKRYDVTYQVTVIGSKKPWVDRFEERLHLTEVECGWEVGFTVEGGKVTWTGDVDGIDYRPARLLSPYRFLLGYLGEGPFLAVNEGFRGMGFYNFHPDSMRDPQLKGGSNRLDRHGKNLPGVIAGLEDLEGLGAERLDRIAAYLRAIVPEVEKVGLKDYGDYETVRYHVRCCNGDRLEFDASSMSDGTLRATAALLAVFQKLSPGGDATVVGIEEPEAALHPAAVRCLLDALLEATTRTQVILTTHSTDLLDEPLVTPEQLRIVRLYDGRTQMAPVDEASREIVREELNTLAGLHREGRLKPDPEDLERQQNRR